MSELAPLGIVVDTNAPQAARSLDSLAAAARGVGKEVDNLAASQKGGAAAGTALATSAAAAKSELEKAAKAAEEMNRRLIALRTAVDPAYAQLNRLTGELQNAEELFRANAISAGEYRGSLATLQGKIASIRNESVGGSGALSQMARAVLQSVPAVSGYSNALGSASVAADVLAGVVGIGLVAGLAAAVVAGRAAIDVYQAMNEVSAETKKAVDASTTANDNYVKAVKEAQTATGELRQMLDEDAAAARRNAEEKKKLAVANLQAAQSALAVAQASAPANSRFDLNGTASEAVGAGVMSGWASTRAQTQIDAYNKGLRDQKEAVLALQQQIESGGRGALSSLQQQNAEFGKTKGQIILMKAEIEASKPANAAFAAQIRDQAYLAAQHADSETKRARAVRDTHKAIKEAAAEPDYRYAVASASVAKDRADAAMVIDIKPKIDTSGIDTAAAHISVTLDQTAREAREAFTSAADEFGWGFDRAFNDLKNKDWMFALGGLFSAIDKLKDSWSSLSTGGKIGAVAGVANAAGQAIGGSAGAVLGGAAGGAMAGFTVAGPIGAAVGAIAGGIIGLFSSSSAKKKASAEAAAQAASDAAAHAQEVLNQYRTIEVEKLQLSGQGMAALNLQREIERAGIAAENLAAYDELVAMRDANSLRELSIQLLEAEGRTGEASAMRQKDALDALTPAQAALTQQIWDATAATTARANAEAIHTQAVADADQAIAQAQNDLTAARNAETQAARDQAQQAAQTAQASRDMWQGFSDGLTQFQRDIGAQSAGASGASYGLASSQFYANGARAALGDKDAQSQFIALGQAFASSSAINARSAIQQSRDLAGIQRTTEAAKATASRQVDIQQAQLDAANAQLASLQSINEGVLSVAQATANLAAALAAKAQLTGAGYAANDNGGTSFGSSSADIQKLMATGLVSSDGPAASGPGYADLLLSQYYAGQLDPGSGTFKNLKAAGFATGGSGVVGGSGGPDSQFIGLKLTPGELVNVDKKDRNAELLAEMRAMREEIAGFRRDQSSVPSDGKKTADMLTFVTRNGDAVRTKEVAA